MSRQLSVLTELIDSDVSEPWQLKIQQGSQNCRKKWYRHLSQRAAVTIILEKKPDLGLSCLMIERAVFAKDQWSGHMAFPGGKHDAADQYIQQTAYRELFEELSIDRQEIEPIARLSDINARSHRPMHKAMVISPFVCKAAVDLKPIYNDEVADAIWVPIEYFNDQNKSVMHWRNRQLPCYFYQGKRIWGLSLMMIFELLTLLGVEEK